MHKIIEEDGKLTLQVTIGVTEDFIQDWKSMNALDLEVEFYQIMHDEWKEGMIAFIQAIEKRNQLRKEIDKGWDS